MLPDAKIGCHRAGFTKTCRECVIDHGCQLWVQLQGHNPNTGEPMNQWACADKWMPLLMIENSQMQRQTGAAVESFRNEVLLLNGRSTQGLLPNTHGYTQIHPALAKTP